MALRRTLVIGAALLLAGASALRAQQSFKAIWGSGPTDIWAVGDGGAALHFDGQAWTPVNFGGPVLGGISAVWGSGPTDVFMGGDAGTIIQWTGQEWTRLTVPTDHTIVALAGRSAAEVYALAQSYSDTESPTLLTWNGRVWAPTPLPMPFRGNALAVSGATVLVAGWAMRDPVPNQRRTYGVLARRLGLRWVMAGWNGRAVTDRVAAAAGWRAVSAVGAAVLLMGENDEGERWLALSRGAAFTALPPEAGPGNPIDWAFLAADGVPVGMLGEAGVARYVRGAWVVTSPQVSAAGGLSAQQLMQAARSPMSYVAQQVAWQDLSNTEAAWGPSNDFYAATSQGRIIHVHADTAQIVYDASCVNPQMAAMNPICRGLQPQGPRPPLPMPSVRTKPRP